MDLGLQGKVVIVTGATANIGRGIALEFAAEGAAVVVVGRDHVAGAKVVERALAAGAAAALFVAADLLDPESPARILAAAERLGPVDVLVNGLGGNVDQGLFVDSDPAKWLGDIDLNFGTMLRMTHAVLPGMVARKAGAIVNIGSTAGLVGDYMLPVYSAMKGAVHSFSVVLAKELGQHGIRVNAVAPWATSPTTRRRSAPAAAFTRTTRCSASTPRRSATRTRACACAARMSAARLPPPRKSPHWSCGSPRTAPAMSPAKSGRSTAAA